jgi:hypothetical protein
MVSACTASGNRRRASGIETGLCTDEPLLAATGKGFAAFPQREGLFERRRTLLEFIHDPDELIASLLV